MFLSLALVLLVGLALASLCRALKLPRLLGMLVAGVLLGPYVLDLLDPSLLGISADLRKMALVIILIKAGLSLDLRDLKKVGRPAVLLSFLPAVMEILAFVAFAPPVLGVTLVEAAIMGAVLGAVSPAVVVPRMVQLMDEKVGTDKSIPQMILAGASLDDVFVIVLFTSFVGMAQGGNAHFTDFLNVPVSIVLGIFLGAAAGFALAWFFETCRQVRNTMKVILLLGVSFLLLAVESLLEGTVAVSGLLAVMSMAMVLAKKSAPAVQERLREKVGKLWLGAEVLLFVLVGAAVDIRTTLDAGAAAIALVFLSLLFRSAGVLICLVKTPLSWKERLFCIIAYLPKATVQAAIGGIPLALGLPCGNLVLSVAVLSIVVTAPLGAFGMDLTYGALLTKEP